jgi:hypothetical protein
MKTSILSGLIVKNISAWLDRKNLHQQATFSIRPTGNVYILGTQEIPEKEFLDKYPIELFPPTIRRENYDKTKNFISNKKSY